VAGPGGESYTGEATVVIPDAFELAVRGVTMAEGLAVNCWLPRSGRAILDVLDVGGRHLASRELSVDHGGELRVEFGREMFPPGLYFVRLKDSRATVFAKAAVVR
jgi:hypothetical protein